MGRLPSPPPQLPLSVILVVVGLVFFLSDDAAVVVHAHPHAFLFRGIRGGASFPRDADDKMNNDTNNHPKHHHRHHHGRHHHHHHHVAAATRVAAASATAASSGMQRDLELFDSGGIHTHDHPLLRGAPVRNSIYHSYDNNPFPLENNHPRSASNNNKNGHHKHSRHHHHHRHPHEANAVDATTAPMLQVLAAASSWLGSPRRQRHLETRLFLGGDGGKKERDNDYGQDKQDVRQQHVFGNKDDGTSTTSTTTPTKNDTTSNVFSPPTLQPEDVFDKPKNDSSKTNGGIENEKGDDDSGTVFWKEYTWPIVLAAAWCVFVLVSGYWYVRHYQPGHFCGRRFRHDAAGVKYNQKAAHVDVASNISSSSTDEDDETFANEPPACTNNCTVVGPSNPQQQQPHKMKMPGRGNC